MEDICLLSLRSESKMKPRLRADSEGERVEPWKCMVGDSNLERCCGVPMRRNSVFDGLTVSRLDESQLCTV